MRGCAGSSRSRVGLSRRRLCEGGRSVAFRVCGLSGVDASKSFTDEGLG